MVAVIPPADAHAESCRGLRRDETGSDFFMALGTL